MRLAIGIVGAGSIGSVVAARLAADGGDVTVFARAERLRSLGRDGLVLHGQSGTVRVMPALSDRPRPGTLDVLMTAVKSHDLPRALSAFLPALRDDGSLVPFVNGLPWWYGLGRSGAAAEPFRSVDPDGLLVRQVGRHVVEPAAIVGTVVFLRAALAANGSVSAAGERIVLGGLCDRPPAHLATLAMLLNRAGIATRVSDNIRADAWSKIALNLATNPLSVVSGATLESMFGDPTLLPLVTAMLGETIDVAVTDGIPPSTDLAGLIEIGRGAGAFMTSMAQDQAAGRPLELAGVVDGVLELAARHGRAMPVTSAVANPGTPSGVGRAGRLARAGA